MIKFACSTIFACTGLHVIGAVNSTLSTPSNTFVVNICEIIHNIKSITENSGNNIYVLGSIELNMLHCGNKKYSLFSLSSIAIRKVCAYVQFFYLVTRRIKLERTYLSPWETCKSELHIFLLGFLRQLCVSKSINGMMEFAPLSKLAFSTFHIELTENIAY